MGVRNDILCPIYLMTVETQVGDTVQYCYLTLLSREQFLAQFCSLNKMSTQSIGYNCDCVQIKPMKFVDIADPSRDKTSAIAINSNLETIQHEKRIPFSAEKCELLKINRKYNNNGFKVSR